jgi:osmoprotectant transport system ATP-binding protein
MTDEPAISAIHVCVDRGGGRLALDDVSLDVRRGDFLAIVGPSGSGKTTLLRLINRLADPTAGDVKVGGVNVREQDPIALRRRIGYVFQGVGLFPHLTVAENIAITPKLLGWDAARRQARARELLALVRLDENYLTRFPDQLSGGERQRIGIARALAAEPAIVLMDEPFSALDPSTRDALSQDYRRLHERLGLTSVMVTHDMLEALLLADRIAVLRGGRLVAHDTPAALVRAQDDAFVQGLMQVPRRQADRFNDFMRGHADG